MKENTPKMPAFSVKKLVRILSLALFALGFMPMCLVSCSGESREFGALDAIKGVSMNLYEGYDQELVKPQPLMLLVFLLPLLIFALTWLRQLPGRANAGIGIGAVVVDLIVWFRFRSAAEQLANENYCGFKTTGWYGLNLVVLVALLILLALVAANVRSMDAALFRPIPMQHRPNTARPVNPAPPPGGAGFGGPGAVIGYCAKCGAPLKAGTRFCGACGTPIVAEAPRQEPAPAASPAAMYRPEASPTAPAAGPVGWETSPVQSAAEPVSWKASPTAPAAEPVNWEATPVQPAAEPVSWEEPPVQPAAGPVGWETSPTAPAAEPTQLEQGSAVDVSEPVPPAPTALYCPECGAKLPPLSRFCPECGTPVE